MLTFIVFPRILSKLQTDCFCFTASERNLWFVKEERVIKCFWPETFDTIPLLNAFVSYFSTVYLYFPFNYFDLSNIDLWWIFMRIHLTNEGTHTIHFAIIKTQIMLTIFKLFLMIPRKQNAKVLFLFIKRIKRLPASTFISPSVSIFERYIYSLFNSIFIQNIYS